MDSQYPQLQDHSNMEQTSSSFFKHKLHQEQLENNVDSKSSLKNSKRISVEKIHQGKQNLQEIACEDERISVEGRPKISSFARNQQKSEVGKEKKCKAVRSKKLINMPTVKYIPNNRDIIMKPVQSGTMFKAKIIRNPTCFQNNLMIQMKGQNSELLVTSKEKSVFSTKIHFTLPNSKKIQEVSETSSISEKENHSELGYVTGNFIGSIFNVYETQDGSNELVATIVYCSPQKMWGHREVQIYCRDRRFSTYLQPVDRKLKNLKEVYQRNQSSEAILKFQNAKPKYSESKGMYCLSINGEEHGQPSIHNIIFKDKEQKTIFKFYKNDERSYRLEANQPITPFIAYSFVLTSFNFKWVSQ